MTRHGFFLFGLVTAWLGFAQPSGAQGTIAYYQPQTPIQLWIPPDSFDLSRQLAFSFDGSGTSDLTFTYGVTFIGVRSEASNRILVRTSPPPNIGGPVAPLSPGLAIGPESEIDSLAWYAGFGDNSFQTLIQCIDICTGDFRGQQAYMGVEFERSGVVHYGWVLLNIASQNPSGTIEAWAWETRPGVPILAGAVPEPSTSALLVGGGVLMVWFRRKRNERRG